MADDGPAGNLGRLSVRAGLQGRQPLDNIPQVPLYPQLVVKDSPYDAVLVDEIGYTGRAQAQPPSDIVERRDPALGIGDQGEGQG